MIMERLLGKGSVVWFILLLSVCSCCGGKGSEHSTGDKGSVLLELAAQVKQSGLVERLQAIEERLDRIEGKVDQLSRQVREGGVVLHGPGAGRVTAAEGGGDSAEGVRPPGGVGGDKVVVVAGSPEPDAEDGEEGDESGGEGEAHPLDRMLPFEWKGQMPGEKVRIVLWHAYRGMEKEALDEAISRFAGRFPNVEVDSQEVPFSALRDKLVVTVPRGTGPDLFIFAHNNIGDWLLKGNILAPLSTLIEQYHGFETLGRLMPDTVKALAYDATLYGLPMAFKSHALFYNKKLVQKVPGTVDELIEEAKKVSALGGEGDDKFYGLVYGAGLFYNHALWAQGFGAEILSDKGQASLDTPAMAESIRLVRSMVDPHGILPDLDDNMATFLFNSGKVGFVIKGPWFLGEVDAGIEYGVSVLPRIEDGKPPKPFLGSEGVFLSATSKNPEVAFQVMRYLISDDSAGIRYVKGQQLVPNLAVYKQKEIVSQANPVLDVFRAQAADSVIMSSRPEMQAIWSTMDNALRKTLYGGAEVSRALKEAQEKVDHDIANMGKR